jgi:hypothetical protein
MPYVTHTQSNSSFLRWIDARNRSAQRDAPIAGDVALGQTVRDPGTCPGPGCRFLRSRPEAHAGK